VKKKPLPNEVQAIVDYILAVAYREESGNPLGFTIQSGYNDELTYSGLGPIYGFICTPMVDCVPGLKPTYPLYRAAPSPVQAWDFRVILHAYGKEPHTWVRARSRSHPNEYPTVEFTLFHKPKLPKLPKPKVQKPKAQNFWDRLLSDSFFDPQ
jgi:hypothetical protein